jgi:protein SCO1/2
MPEVIMRIDAVTSVGCFTGSRLYNSQHEVGNAVNPRAILRNPYVWGFLVGIVMLTAIRPFLRRIPEPPPVLFQLPEYALVGMDGKPYGSAELRGQVYIASVFSTDCRSICPPVMKGMARLQDGFAQRKIQGVRLVSISVDPEHDTPEVLTEYAKGIGVDPLRWTLLTGDPAEVRRLAVFGFKTPEAVHTGKLMLVDGSGRVRGFYGSDEMGLDEVYNRAQHVLRQERETKGPR